MTAPGRRRDELEADREWSYTAQDDPVLSAWLRELS